MNIINLLLGKFRQCLGTFTMLLVDGFSETGIFRHLSDYVSGFRNSGIPKFMTVIILFFFQYVQDFHVDLKLAPKNSEKVFCFLDNCIWIGIVKFSPSRTGYILSAANVLTNSAKISHVNKGDFCRLSWLGSDQSI